MTDHITDASITAALKRAEKAEREAERLRALFILSLKHLAQAESKAATYFRRFLIACALLAAIAFAAALSDSCITNAITARDACEVQSQLYLDGWRQCKREADTAKTIPLTIESLASATPVVFRYVAPDMRGYVDSHGHCHGSIPRSECAKGRRLLGNYDGSLLDPTPPLGTIGPAFKIASFRNCGTERGYVDGEGRCHGKLTKKECETGRRLMRMPRRRIDR